MNDFSIFSNFELSIKPDWLDEFRHKYDTSLPYHLTWKNSSFIQTGTEEDLKKEVQSIASTMTPFKVSFHRAVHDLTKRGECIMLEHEQTPDLQNILAIQKQISQTFKKYGRHIKETYKEYENNFYPHLTIARHLSVEDFQIAWQVIESNQASLYCEATIQSLTLVLAKVEDEKEIPETRKLLEYPFAQF